MRGLHDRSRPPLVGILDGGNRFVPVGAAFDRRRRLTHHEVVDRQIIRVLLRGAGHRALQIDAAFRGLDHVGLAAVLTVRVQNLKSPNSFAGDGA